MLFINGVAKEAQIEVSPKALNPVVYALLLIISVAFAYFGFSQFVKTYIPNGVLSVAGFSQFRDEGVVESTESVSVEPAELTVSADGVEEYSVFENLLEPLFYAPKTLVIDTLGIRAEIISVTTQEGGFLETPTDWNQIGWYKRGALAGEEGNLLLNGHYDTNTGSAAALWELKNIAVGDKVVVEDRLGRTFTYTVLEKYYIDINDPDRTKVFQGSDNKRVLTLITCGGVWLPSQGTYNKRLIVRGELDTGTE
jgi:LPXTG-site transpeptidase (sortase) family protein